MSTQLIHVAAVAPIPVGHRVEIRIYAEEEGLFSKTWTPRFHDPHIVDLTSGITYGSVWLFEAVNMYRCGEVRPDIPFEIRSDIREHARMTGTVRVCRITWIGAGDSRYPQTTLAVEPG
jgi:hypothetical protein